MKIRARRRIWRRRNNDFSWWKVRKGEKKFTMTHWAHRGNEKVFNDGKRWSQQKFSFAIKVNCKVFEPLMTLQTANFRIQFATIFHGFLAKLLVVGDFSSWMWWMTAQRNCCWLVMSTAMFDHQQLHLQVVSGLLELRQRKSLKKLWWRNFTRN